MKSGVEYLAQHPGWKTVGPGKPFFRMLSGKETYFDQWEAWEKLCAKHGTDGATVLGLLNRAHESVGRK
jgi:hypothetical protein